MVDIEREKKILEELAAARNAVKRKYNLLKFQKYSIEKTLGETFKPITKPLDELVSLSKEMKERNKRKVITKSLNKKKKSESIHDDTLHEQNSNTDNNLEDSFNESNTSELDETVIQQQSKDKSDIDNDLENASNKSETSEQDDTELQQQYNDSDFDTADEAESSGDRDEDIIEELKLPLLRDKNDIDKVYGVRKADNNDYMIGNLPISFTNNVVSVAGMEYQNTAGLLELLFKKKPDQNLITRTDKGIYRAIVDASSVHRKGHEANQPLRRSNSTKFTKFIAPMFLEQQQQHQEIGGKGLLPRYKIAKLGMKMDYVYWDDPNELVERLQLLMAERHAGNPSHDNEIQSIIEELYERGYIY